MSDDDCLHNHPWSFLSIILKTGYKEFYLKHIYTDHPDPLNSYYTYHTEIHSKIVRPGAVLWRPADWFHRLEIDKPAWTLVVTFKKVQEWGFLTSRGWIPWHKYSPQSKCE